MNSEQITARLTEEKIIAVVVFQKEAEVAPTIEALLKGGVRTIELALRSEYALTAVKRIRTEYPEIGLGIGTVITPKQVEQVQELGADFAVAPGLNRKVIERAQQLNFPFYPGITTASELETALEYNIKLLKFFPAEPVGGLQYLESLNNPYAHLGLRYIPLGGVNPQNLASYLQYPAIGAVGGSWLAPRKLIEAEQWTEIEQKTKEAIAIKENIS